MKFVSQDEKSSCMQGKIKANQRQPLIKKVKRFLFNFTFSSYVQIRYKLEILLPWCGRKDRTDEKQAQRKTKHSFELILLQRNAINGLRLTS